MCVHMHIYVNIGQLNFSWIWEKAVIGYIGITVGRKEKGKNAGNIMPC